MYSFSWIRFNCYSDYDFENAEGHLYGCCEFLMNESAPITVGVLTSLTQTEVKRYIKELEKLLDVTFTVSDLDIDEELLYDIDDDDGFFDDLVGEYKRATTKLFITAPNIHGPFKLIMHTGLRYLWSQPKLVQRFLELRKTYRRYPALLLAHMSIQGTHNSYGNLVEWSEALPYREFKARLEAFKNRKDEEVTSQHCDKCHRDLKFVSKIPKKCYCGAPIDPDDCYKDRLDTTDLFGDFTDRVKPLTLHRKSLDAILDELRYTGPRLIKGN